MKKLNKIYINSAKLIADNELLTLKGGHGTNCGPGFLEYYCDIIPCSGCSHVTGIACGVTTSDVLEALQQMYPDIQGGSECHLV